MFAKQYHPLDSRHPGNRAKAKEMQARRLSETRAGKIKAASGGLFTSGNAQTIRAQLQAVEAAPVVDLETQKRLKKRLRDPARLEAERDFWKRQPWYMRFGTLRLLNMLRAHDAGQAAIGTPVWLRVVSIPLALVLYFGLMRLDETFHINAFLQNLLQHLASLF